MRALLQGISCQGLGAERLLEKLKAAKVPGHKPPAWFGDRNLE